MLLNDLCMKRNKELENDLPTLIENILAKKNPWEIKNAA